MYILKWGFQIIWYKEILNIFLCEIKKPVIRLNLLFIDVKLIFLKFV